MAAKHDDEDLPALVGDESEEVEAKEVFKDTTAKDIARYADLLGIGGADDKVSRNF